MTNIIQFPDLNERDLSALAADLEEWISGHLAPDPPLSDESRAEIIAWFVEQFRTPYRTEVAFKFEIPAGVDPDNPGIAQVVQRSVEAGRHAVMQAVKNTSNEHMHWMLRRSIELFARIEGAKREALLRSAPEPRRGPSRPG